MSAVTDLGLRIAPKRDENAQDKTTSPQLRLRLASVVAAESLEEQFRFQACGLGNRAA